jgi:hypothetical protein
MVIFFREKRARDLDLFQARRDEKNRRFVPWLDMEAA